VSGGQGPTPSFSRSRGEHAFKDQLTTERDRQGIVDRQYSNRRSTRGSKTPKSRAMPPEVVGPAVAAGMIELGDFMCYFVDFNEVWALVPIASGAGHGQVAESSFPAMLSGDDVVDLKRQSVSRLGQLAVLAQPPGTDTNTLFQVVSHRDEPSLSSHASALEGLASFGLHDRQDIRCLDVFVELLLL